MKQAYKSIKFSEPVRKLISFLDTMITEYQRENYTLSVRQLYYQLVARGVVENTEKSYKRVASIINDARLAGLLDWDAIRAHAFAAQGKSDEAREALLRIQADQGMGALQQIADRKGPAAAIAASLTQATAYR